MILLSKADWWSLATLLSQLQHDLSPNLGIGIVFLSEVLATIITIPGNCSFLEINCHRKLCFLFQWTSKFHFSAWRRSSMVTEGVTRTTRTATSIRGQRRLCCVLQQHRWCFCRMLGALFLVEKTNLRNELFPPFFQVLETKQFAYCKKQF